MITTFELRKTFNLYSILEDDNEKIFDFDDEDLEGGGFGLVDYNGNMYTLPAFMFDKNTLYVHDYHEMKYHVLEIEEEE